MLKINFDHSILHYSKKRKENINTIYLHDIFFRFTEQGKKSERFYLKDMNVYMSVCL
jgi:hypothetical protein